MVSEREEVEHIRLSIRRLIFLVYLDKRLCYHGLQLIHQFIASFIHQFFDNNDLFILCPSGKCRVHCFIGRSAHIPFTKKQFHHSPKVTLSNSLFRLEQQRPIDLLSRMLNVEGKEIKQNILVPLFWIHPSNMVKKKCYI